MEPWQSNVSTKKGLIQVALGQRKADLYLQNGHLVNVCSGEILEGHNIAIGGQRIAYVGPSREMITPETEVIDAAGAYLLPGYIDPHAHVDFWANPLALTPHFLTSGTTAVMADPHDIVGAVGLTGLELLIEMTSGLPLKFFFSLPVSSPPFPEFEGEDVVPLAAMEGYLARGEILALSEVTPWIRLTSADSDLLARFELGERWGKSVEGHTTGASFDKLNALVAAGLTSCHEALNAGEARERLRLGLAVMLRHGSIRSDLEALIGLVTEEPKVDTRGVMFTPDWKSPSDVLKHGYMDHLVRLAIELGVPPITAIQMATLNPAVYLRLDRGFGSLTPGRRADILLVDDLRRPTPRTIIADGRVVARNGEFTFDLPPLPASAIEIPWLPHRIIPVSLSPADFIVEATSSTGQATVPAIAIVNKTITQRQDVALPIRDGQICLPADQDILKIGLLNRDSSGFVIAFLTGFGAKVGGLAASVAHELHKPMVVGCREDDMVAALRRVRELGGGMVLVHEGQVLAEIPLPIGGLMSAGS
ncbi:MAG: amidohydrolase family protein, partial [Anaerolineae bacterium]|nr:amidohydrolase family protein [Anaerolineae bacterium]